MMGHEHIHPLVAKLNTAMNTRNFPGTVSHSFYTSEKNRLCKLPTTTFAPNIGIAEWECTMREMKKDKNPRKR